MLSKKRIHQLIRRVEEGNQAKALLDQYNGLMEQKEQLEKIKNFYCSNCRRIKLEYEQSRNVEFKVDLPSFDLEEIEKTLEGEIKLLDNKLECLK